MRTTSPAPPSTPAYFSDRDDNNNHHHHHHHHWSPSSSPSSTTSIAATTTCPPSSLSTYSFPTDSPPAKTRHQCTTNRKPCYGGDTCPYARPPIKSPCMAGPPSQRPLSPASHDEEWKSLADTPVPKWLDTSGNSVPPPAEARATTPPLSTTLQVKESRKEEPPTVLHKFQHERSILSLAVSEKYVFAGSQSGEILVGSIETYELVHRMKGHNGSVLCLCLTPNQSTLLSSGGDAIVQVWDAQKFQNLYTIYSTYDVGDVFCVAFSASLQIAWLGAQNTSIQWYDLKRRERDVKRPPLTSHPSRRSHRFFDSKGPGGRSAPKPDGDGEEEAPCPRRNQLEIEPENIVQYAHYGYVYCMLVVAGAQIGREGEYLLSGGGDGDVKLWSINPATGAISQLHRMEGGDSGVLSMAIKDTFLYCGLTDGEICLWDLDTFQMVRTVRAHCDDVLTLSVGGDFVFSGSASGYVRKWNTKFECISRWRAHNGLVLASATTTKGSRMLFLTSGNDNTVSIADVAPPGQSTTAATTTSLAQPNLLLSTLAKLISFNSSSSNREECRRAATYLKTLFRQFGATSELIPTEDSRNPIVYARFSAPATAKQRGNGKNILFYGHYDIIPADPKTWNTDPFQLTGVNGYLYARGVSDNKGPVLAALFAAGELHQSGRLSGDIIFLIEGEEESGSRGFEGAVKSHLPTIGPVDWILAANSYWLDDVTPALTYGLRGVVQATVTISSPLPDLHSGVDGSKLYQEPTNDLISLLATLTTPDNIIAIPDFYIPVRPITPAENAMYEPLASVGSARELQAKWRHPSLTVHKLEVSGPGNSTIIPSSAKASISLRIVPDQTSKEVAAQLVEFLRMRYRGPNRLDVSIDHTCEPWLGEPGNCAFRTLERAVRRAWFGENEAGAGPCNDEKQEDENGIQDTSATSPSSSPSPTSPSASPFLTSSSTFSAVPQKPQKEPKIVYIREGGSIPGIRFLEDITGAKAAHLPCGQRSDAAHLDNERLRVRNLFKSKDILQETFDVLSRGEDTAVNGRLEGGIPLGIKLEAGKRYSV